MKTSQKYPPFEVIPTLLWFFVFLIIPLCIVIVFSVLHKGEYGKIIYQLDFKNYARAFEPVYLNIIWRSVVLAGYTTFACLFFAFPLAYYMARAPKHMKPILLGLVIVPFWTNFVIRVYSLKLVLGENGTVNRVLMHLHLIHQPLQLTDNIFGIAIGMLYNYLPFMILPLYVALEKLDFMLLDAAYDLGANRIQTVWKVLIPLSLPGVVTGSLFVFIPAFGEFVIPDLLGGSQNMFVGTLISEIFLKVRDWPFGSALSSFLVLFAMVSFLMVHSRSMREKELKSAA